MDLIGYASGILPKVLKWFGRPKLRIYFDPPDTEERVRTRVPSRPPMPGVTADGHRVEVNPWAVWYHLHVANDGHSVASECRAQLDVIEQATDGHWQLLPAFRARVPVAWANTGGELVANIHAGRPERVDLGYVLDDEAVFHFHSPLPASGFIRGLSVGRYRLTVTVLSKDGASASMKVVLDFGGDSESVTVTAEM